VRRFEDLIAWQKARELNRAVYAATDARPLSLDRGLASQMQRAAVSVMGNIAEGFERTGPAEFHHALSIAKGSCAEVRSHLYAALDARRIDQLTFDGLLAQADEVGRLLGGLRASLRR